MERIGTWKKRFTPEILIRVALSGTNELHLDTAFQRPFLLCVSV